MLKKSITKYAAIFALFGFFLLSVPALAGAPKKASKFDLRILIKKPAAWVSSFMSFLTPIFDTENPDSPKGISSDSSSTKVKPLGGLAAPRPSSGD